MKEVLVSVIMAVYNEPNNIIEESLRSILQQSHNKLELIIIVDGKKDKYDFITSFKDLRIKVFLNDVNQGLSYSLNRAISMSSSDYIFRMDADDISTENRISEQLAFLLNGKKIVSSLAYFIDQKNHFKGKSKKFYFHNFISRLLLYKMRGSNPVIHPTIAARKDVFINYKYDCKLRSAQDYELWLRMYPKIKIFFIPKYHLYYRIKQTKNDSKKKLMKNIEQKNGF